MSSGKTVVVVDDGIATGLTTRAAVEYLRRRGAAKIVVAVPVAPPDSKRMLEQVADEVIVLDTPRDFWAVGQYYRRFDQTEDAEVVRLLDEAHRRAERTRRTCRLIYSNRTPATSAKMPSPPMTAPETRLTQTIVRVPTRSRKRLTTPESSSHHPADPQNTPSTSHPAPSPPPLPARPRPAKTAANEMIVDGFVKREDEGGSVRGPDAGFVSGGALGGCGPEGSPPQDEQDRATYEPKPRGLGGKESRDGRQAERGHGTVERVGGRRTQPRREPDQPPMREGSAYAKHADGPHGRGDGEADEQSSEEELHASPLVDPAGPDVVAVTRGGEP